MLDNPDKWGRLKQSQDVQLLSIKNKNIIHKQDMGKLGSRLGSLVDSEYEAMILSDIETMHKDSKILKGNFNKIWILK